VPFPDCGGAAAERQGGGFSRCIWGHGLSDSVRSARLGNAALEGDHDLGDCVHVDVCLFVDCGDEEFRECRQHDSGAALGEDGYTAEPGADPGESNSGEFCSEAGSSRAGTGSDSGSGKEVGIATRPRNAEVAELADALA
jgi:hypothetical protein